MKIAGPISQINVQKCALLDMQSFFVNFHLDKAHVPAPKREFVLTYEATGIF